MVRTMLPMKQQQKYGQLKKPLFLAEQPICAPE